MTYAIAPVFGCSTPWAQRLQARLSRVTQEAKEQTFGCGLDTIIGRQDEVVAFLSNAASYGLPGAFVERIETHCSIVFVIDDRAYKLKRAVAFSALDYSTLERRAAACRAELALNRRTAPELYLGVRAIRRTLRGELAFADRGPIVDWVVVMRRFDQADMFDHLADTRHLTPELVRALADEIAAFHEAAECTPAFGGASGLRDAIERNHCDQLTVESVLGHASIEALYTASLDALGPVTKRLDCRRDVDKVRRCHGDLRLANICCFDGRPTLFDAIEFADTISCIDVLFDLAFVLMDLNQRGYSVLANILLNRYLDATVNDDGLAALPLMLSICAATRAYCLASGAQRQARQSHATTARSHLTLASAFLAHATPRLIAIGGVQGSAKTALAHHLAATFQPLPGGRVVQASVALRTLLHLPLQTRLPAADNEALTDATYDQLCRKAKQVLDAGFTAVVDASFFHTTHRRAIRAVASTAAVPFVGLWLGPFRDLQVEGAVNEDTWHSIQIGSAPARMFATARILALGASR